MSVIIRALNEVTFDRLKSPECRAYEIYRCVEGMSDTLISTIDHPHSPERMPMSKELLFNERKQWYVGDNIISESQVDVTVYINGQAISRMDYTYKSSTNSLIIHCTLTSSDIVNINYFVDKVRYIDYYTGKCTYKVVPLFKEGTVTGKHSYLHRR